MHHISNDNQSNPIYTSYFPNDKWWDQSILIRQNTVRPLHYASDQGFAPFSEVKIVQTTMLYLYCCKTELECFHASYFDFAGKAKETRGGDQHGETETAGFSVKPRYCIFWNKNSESPNKPGKTQFFLKNIRNYERLKVFLDTELACQ